MGLLVFIVAMLTILAIIGAIASYSASESYVEGPNRARRYPYRKYSGILAILAVILFGGSFVVAGLVQVPAGHRAVVLNWGAVTGKILPEGLHYIVPIAQKKVDMSVQVQAYETEATAASKDLQDVVAGITVNFTIDPKQVDKIYQTLRLDYTTRIIKPGVQESVKSVTAHYLAEELITRRADVKAEISNVLRERLATHSILVETVSITDFDFSESFNDAIEAKVTAVQKALEAENKLIQIEVEARQVEQIAKGQAAAAIAKAEGDATAMAIVAEATANANKTIEASLTEAVLRYMYINKLNPNAQTIYVPTDATILVGGGGLK